VPLYEKNGKKLTDKYGNDLLTELTIKAKEESQKIKNAIYFWKK